MEGQECTVRCTDMFVLSCMQCGHYIMELVAADPMNDIVIDRWMRDPSGSLYCPQCHEDVGVDPWFARQHDGTCQVLGQPIGEKL